MRHDMFKVIVGRPRRRRDAELYVSKGRVRDLEDLPLRESMRAGRRRGWNQKELNENLAPLRRFLRSRVGTAWNDVFSEICAEISVNSTVQKHVRDHLRDLVDINCFRGGDGGVYVRTYVGTRRAGPLYVDPDDGILRDAGPVRRWRPTKKQDPNIIPVSDTVRLQRIDGLWFEVTLAPLPSARHTWVKDDDGTCRLEIRSPFPVFDAVLKRTIWPPFAVRRDENSYAVAKRSLSKTELSRLGLKNETQA